MGLYARAYCFFTNIGKKVHESARGDPLVPQWEIPNWVYYMYKRPRDPNWMYCMYETPKEALVQQEPDQGL